MLASVKTPAEQIVEFMNRVYYNRMTTVSGGNISIYEDDGSVWISPSGIDKGSLTVDDIVRITPDGVAHGKNRPSMEHLFHRAIYKQRPDIRTILHAHPPMLVSFSIAGRIPAVSLLAGAAKGCGKINYAPYAVPGSEKLGANIAAEFARGYDVVMLENHGVVVGGATLPESFQKFETLDHLGRMVYGAKLLGGEKGAAVDPDDGFASAGTCRKTPEEEREAENIAKFCRRAYQRCLFRSGYGAIALRTSAGRFLLTVAECERENLTAAEVAVVDATGCEPGKQVSASLTDYCRTVFAGAPDIKAVYCAQPPAIMAYALSGTVFDPRVIPESYLLLRETPHFPAGGRHDAARRMSARYPAVLVANDCVLTAGGSLIQAFDRLEVLEYSAQATISALAFGGMKPMGDAQIAEIIREFKLEP